MKKSVIEIRKIELQKQLDKIVETERRLMVIENYPVFKQKYEGKYFKYDNGYSEKERWPMYVKVTSIKPEDVYDTNGNGVTSHYSGWSFQTDTHNSISIDKVRQGYVHGLGKEISESEFNAAWNKMINAINSL